MNLTPTAHAYLATILSLAENAAKVIRSTPRDSIEATIAQIDLWNTLVAFNTDKDITSEDRKATRDFRQTIREIIAKAHTDSITAARK